LTIVEERTVGPASPGFDRRRQAAAYGGGAGGHLYADYLRDLWNFRQYALLIHISMIFARCAAARHADASGIAGIVLTIAWRRFQRADLRAHREESHAVARSSRRSTPLQPRFATIVDSNVPCSCRRDPLFSRRRPVRGFAVSLALGILTTIVTAVTMTRMMSRCVSLRPPDQATDLTERKPPVLAPRELARSERGHSPLKDGRLGRPVELMRGLKGK